MKRHDDLLQRVERARPADPDAAEAQGVAVRTLARFAVLEAGWSAAPTHAPRPARRLLRGAAILLAALLPLAAWGHGGEAEAPVRAASTTKGTALSDRVARALGGDDLARQRLVRGGLVARRALLGAAERGGAKGRDALTLLASAGPLRSAGEARRVALLARDPRLRAHACALLGRDLGAHGPRLLGELLALDPEAEADTVASLEGVAERGRREAALAALLQGVRRARPLAAAAAIRVGGGTHLARVIAALPEGRGVQAAAAGAVRRGARTLKARLVRIAERGDGRALRLATAACVAGIVPVLQREALRPEAARARAAVDLLAGLGNESAWLALARVHDGDATEHVAAHLRAAPGAIDDALVRHARRSRHEAPLAMRALALRGSVQRLRELARESRLAPTAIDALGRVAGAEASRHLADLAGRSAWTAHAVATLAERVARGRSEAGPALLALARDGRERAVMRALAGAGAPGIALLQSAALDPHLGSRARRALERIPGALATHTTARAKRRTKNSRSI